MKYLLNRETALNHRISGRLPFKLTYIVQPIRDNFGCNRTLCDKIMKLCTVLVHTMSYSNDWRHPGPVVAMATIFKMAAR